MGFYFPFYQTFQYHQISYWWCFGHHFLETFKTKTVKYKDLFLECKLRKLHQCVPFFVTSVSFYYNKWILSFRFRNPIMEMIKRYKKLEGKTTMKFCFTSLFADLAKQCALVLFEILLSISTTKYLWHLLHIYRYS